MLQKYINSSKKLEDDIVTSKVLLTPISLSNCDPGIYSLDFCFGTKDLVIATDLKVDNKYEVLSIEKKEAYECNVTDSQDHYEVMLYDLNHNLLAKGKSKVFSKFYKMRDLNSSYTTT